MARSTLEAAAKRCC